MSDVQFCFPIPQLPTCRSQQARNSCPLPTLLRYVKPMQLTWDHLSFALTYLLRTSSNLDCTETPRLQDKMHNVVNSNRSTISNPMLTWKIKLWNSGMNQFSGAATRDLAMIMKSIPITPSFLKFNLQKWSHHDFVTVAYVVRAKSNLKNAKCNYNILLIF